MNVELELYAYYRNRPEQSTDTTLDEFTMRYGQGRWVVELAWNTLVTQGLVDIDTMLSQKWPDPPLLPSRSEWLDIVPPDDLEWGGETTILVKWRGV